MRTVHVTGVEHAPEGTIVVRTITVSKRWWQRKARHTLQIFQGYLGDWMVYGTTRPAPKYIAVLLDNAYTAALDDAATAGYEKHSGYEAVGFTIGEQRVVNAARTAMVNPDN